MSLSIYRHVRPLAAHPPIELSAAFAAAAGTPGGPVASGSAIPIALMEVGEWLPWLADASGMLSASEYERVRGRRMAADRDALAVAYALHRLLLGSVLGRPPTDVPVYRDERGCPRVTGDGIHTSLSHADGLIAVAISKWGPVGVDIEPAARAFAMPEIARRVYHYSEATALYVASEPVRRTALLAMWVRKEAILKAAGVGLAVPMESFAAPEHPGLRLPGLFAELIQVRMLDAGDRCVAAVAGPCGAEFHCRWIRPPPRTSLEERHAASTARRARLAGRVPLTLAEAPQAGPRDCPR